MTSTFPIDAPTMRAAEQHDAAQEIFKVISGFWLSRAVQVAATLRVPDYVNEMGTAVEEVAAKTGSDVTAMYRLMRALSSFGIFRELEGRRFTSTHTSDILRSDMPGSLRATVMTELGLVHYSSWGQLLDSVRTGEIAFDRVHGADVWTYFGQHPDIAKTFNESMTHVTEVILRGVHEVYNFSRYRTVADVGGGQGRLLASILNANRHARGVLLDAPSVIDQARRLLAEDPAMPRIEFIAGDFFKEVPEGADLYALKWIIHDWAEPQALQILGNVRRAMTPLSRVVLIETVLPEANTPHFAPMMDLNMLVMTGGRERRASEYRDLLAKAGLRMMKVYPTESPVSVIEAEAA
jgi:ubiquinone/menaquinone biosynthesis C-methylase UbiE